MIRDAVRSFFSPLVKAWEFLRDVPRRIRHICAWLPLLWKDEDWDHRYLLDLVRFKLRRMADYIEEHDRHLNSQRCARDMRITAARLDRYVDSHAYGPPMPDEGLEWEPTESGNHRLKPGSRAMRNWARRHGIITQENWDAAWELVRRKGEHWWD